MTVPNDSINENERATSDGDSVIDVEGLSSEEIVEPVSMTDARRKNRRKSVVTVGGCYMSPNCCVLSFK